MTTPAVDAAVEEEHRKLVSDLKYDMANDWIAAA